MHYNHYVSPYARTLAVSETANHMVYFDVNFDQILHTNACQHDLTTDMCNSLFLMNKGLLSIISAGCGQLVKMLITLEPHTYLF